MKTVLVTVLDWGLGHATRCIPVIRELLVQKVNVLIAGNGRSMDLLKQEFPMLKFIELPAYDVKYSKGDSLVVSLIMQWPRLVRIVKAEKKLIKEVVKVNNVNCIISDNRYGCYHESIKSVVICHQLNLQLPRNWRWAAKLVNSYHDRWLRKFNEVWIPDMPNELKFTGLLSETQTLNCRYIGILSRFDDTQTIESNGFYDVVALVSGPEPQRSIFEKLLRPQLSQSRSSILLVKGLPGDPKWIKDGHFSEVNHLEANDLWQVLKGAKIVIARSGYSTIMDLAALGKRAILIPTPGQTEQEYLAKLLAANNWALVQTQSGMNLKSVWQEVYDLNPMPHAKPNLFLPQAITELLC